MDVDSAQRNECTEILKRYCSVLKELNADPSLHINKEGIAGIAHTDLTKENELLLIKPFKVPEFSPPYPLRVHPKEGESLQAIQDWLFQHSIDTVFHPAKLEQLLFCAALTSRAYPDISYEKLELSCKFMTVTWLVDDMIDDSAIEKSWETTLSLILEIHLVIMSTFPDDQTILEHLMEFVDKFASHLREDIQNSIEDKLFNNKNQPGEIYGGRLSPIASAFRDFWAGAVAAKTNSQSSLRLARYFQKFLISSLTQIGNRKKNHIPSLEEYVLLRRDSGAVICFLIIVELIESVFLPEATFCSPRMTRLMTLFIDFVSWHNDIWSFKKEYLVNGDVHNLVFLLSHHFNCSYEGAALAITKSLYDQCIELDLEIEELLKVISPEDEGAVSRYIAACRDFISGTDDWHKKSLRYK